MIKFWLIWVISQGLWRIKNIFTVLQLLIWKSLFHSVCVKLFKNNFNFKHKKRKIINGLWEKYELSVSQFFGLFVVLFTFSIVGSHFYHPWVAESLLQVKLSVPDWAKYCIYTDGNFLHDTLGLDVVLFTKVSVRCIFASQYRRSFAWQPSRNLKTGR